jgi:hypothetical protein
MVLQSQDGTLSHRRQATGLNVSQGDFLDQRYDGIVIATLNALAALSRSSCPILPHMQRLPTLWLLLLLSLSCGPSFDGLRSPEAVRDRFARRVAQGPGTLVPLGEMTAFGYKTAFIFGPYTSQETIRSWLDIEADEAVRLGRGIERRDDIHLLVFSFEHVGLDSMEIPRSLADFGPDASPCAFILVDAVFVVQQDGRLGLAPGVACKGPSEP